MTISRSPQTNSEKLLGWFDSILIWEWIQCKSPWLRLCESEMLNLDLSIPARGSVISILSLLQRVRRCVYVWSMCFCSKCSLWFSLCVANLEVINQQKSIGSFTDSTWPVLLEISELKWHCCRTVWGQKEL